MEPSSKGKIFHDFRKLVPVKKILKKYSITEEELINILQRNIKGNYDYKQIFKGELKAHKQFIKHLNNRFDPLNPHKEWKQVSPYVPFKEKKNEQEGFAHAKGFAHERK